MSRTKTVLEYVGAVAIGLLSLAAFGAVLGLGIWGILVAKDLNLCEPSNATDECVFEVTMTSDLNDTDPTSLVVPEVDELEWMYYMLGSTGAAVLWALLSALTMVFVVEIMHVKQKRDLEKIHNKEKRMEMAERGERGGKVEESAGQEEGKVEEAGVRRDHLSDSDEPDVEEQRAKKKEEMKDKLVSGGVKPKDLRDLVDEHHAKVTIDYIGAYHVREWYGKPLRHLGVWGYFVLFFSFLTFITSLMSLLWAVALGYYHTNRVEKRVSEFAVVEFLAGILLPLLLFLSSVLLAIVVDYVTIGRVDARKRIKRFLPSVVFEEGVENDYWVIEERFYFKLKRRDHHLDHGFWYSCDKSLSTWLLTAIAALSLLLCFSYFVNVSIVEEETRSSCPDQAIGYDCFNRSTFNFVDCANEGEAAHVELIHCFRFLRFAVDTNIITSFSQAFAFYLATVAVFGRVFSAVKTLLHIHRTRLWGILFLVVGTLAFFITAIFLGIEDRFQIQVNVISVLQVCMACLFIFLVGVLVLRGNWYEKIFDNKKVKPLAELLLHYDSISTAQVHKIEHTYAERIKEGDPQSAHVVDTPV